MTRKDFEIMAPVGSWESLAAAVQAGADSVYFGLGQLNMRSASSLNFTLADLALITDKCRASGVKTYLTLNAVMFDEDLPAMQEQVDAASRCGVDAVIASDMAVVGYARSRNVPVHASTQLNISNIESVRFFAAFCDVVVLARELSLSQVAGISAEIDREHITGPSGDKVRIEMFCHGALCMAVSGKCYLSLHQHNKSANRGSCLQVCRRGYAVQDFETGEELTLENKYIMSPKDLCTIGFVNKMMDAGVRLFKIEGRARAPEYVKIVTECYHQAIESVLDGSYSGQKVDDWKQRLSTVFNRGFWDGYYLGQKLGEWSHQYGSSATHKKEYIAKCSNYFTKLGVGEFLVETGVLRVGDEILVIGPTTGVIEMQVSEIRIDLESVDAANKGDRFSMPVPVSVRRSDKIYKLVKSIYGQIQ